MKLKKKNDKCECGCIHYPDYGACDLFEPGENGNCVYCDHGEDCHPGTGKYFNLPLGRGKRDKDEKEKS